jgi:hypothetical protein
VRSSALPAAVHGLQPAVVEGLARPYAADSLAAISATTDLQPGDHGLDGAVRDEGVGLRDDWRNGLAIASIREPVAEFGGDLVIEPSPRRDQVRRLPVEPVRVLFADDHPLFLDGLIALLKARAELAGTATTGTEDRRPGLPDPARRRRGLAHARLNAIEATRRIGAKACTRGDVADHARRHDSIFSALRARARVDVLEGAGREQIRCAMQAAASGESILGADPAERMLG